MIYGWLCVSLSDFLMLAYSGIGFSNMRMDRGDWRGVVDQVRAIEMGLTDR